MGLDFNSSDPSGLDSSTSSSPALEGAVPATAGTASFADLDAIQTSPLAYFGDIVEQLGKSMSFEGQNASASGADPSYGVSDAIDMLDGIVSMMSLYATGDGPNPMASNSTELPPGSKALDSKT